jgi:hypothetical protein
LHTGIAEIREGKKEGLFKKDLAYKGDFSDIV